MKKTLVTILAVLLIASFVSAQSMNEYGQYEMQIMVKTDIFEDGSHRVSYFVVDPGTNKLVPLDQIEAIITGINANVFQQAVLTYSNQWDWTKVRTIVWGFTTDAKKYKKNFKQTHNKFINGRRGTRNKPKMKSGSRTDNVKPMDQFNNPFDYYEQMKRDKKNSVIMTMDDQFFKNIFGIIVDPKIIATSWIFSFATLTLSGNRWIGTYFITECDVYLRSDFFSFTKQVWQVILTASLQFCYGFLDTNWGWDILSNNGHFVTWVAFLNKASNVWVLARLMDVILYGTAVVPGSRSVSKDKATLMPEKDEVLDLREYELPEKDQFGQDVLGKTPALFFTNLKGYEGSKKKMVIKIYRYTDDNPPKTVRIVTLNGNPLNYPVTVTGDKRKFYPTIFREYARLGREGDLNKLKNAVNDFGKSKTINGVDFEKVLKIRVVIQGRMTEKSGKKTIRRDYYLVDTPE